MSSSRSFNGRAWDDDVNGPRPLESYSPEDLLVAGLQRRQLGLPTYFFQDELLKAFDVADLAGKRRMLGDAWPKWRHRFEPQA